MESKVSAIVQSTHIPESFLSRVMASPPNTAVAAVGDFVLFDGGPSYSSNTPLSSPQSSSPQKWRSEGPSQTAGKQHAFVVGSVDHSNSTCTLLPLSALSSGERPASHLDHQAFSFLRTVSSKLHVPSMYREAFSSAGMASTPFFHPAAGTAQGETNLLMITRDKKELMLTKQRQKELDKTEEVRKERGKFAESLRQRDGRGLGMGMGDGTGVGEGQMKVGVGAGRDELRIALSHLTLVDDDRRGAGKRDNMMEGVRVWRWEEDKWKKNKQILARREERAQQERELGQLGETRSSSSDAHLVGSSHVFVSKGRTVREYRADELEKETIRRLTPSTPTKLHRLPRLVSSEGRREWKEEGRGEQGQDQTLKKDDAETKPWDGGEAKREAGAGVVRGYNNHESKVGVELLLASEQEVARLNLDEQKETERQNRARRRKERGKRVVEAEDDAEYHPSFENTARRGRVWKEIEIPQSYAVDESVLVERGVVGEKESELGVLLGVIAEEEAARALRRERKEQRRKKEAETNTRFFVTEEKDEKEDERKKKKRQTETRPLINPRSTNLLQMDTRHISGVEGKALGGSTNQKNGKRGEVEAAHSSDDDLSDSSDASSADVNEVTGRVLEEMARAERVSSLLDSLHSRPFIGGRQKKEKRVAEQTPGHSFGTASSSTWFGRPNKSKLLVPPADSVEVILPSSIRERMELLDEMKKMEKQEVEKSGKWSGMVEGNKVRMDGRRRKEGENENGDEMKHTMRQEKLKRKMEWINQTQRERMMGASDDDPALHLRGSTHEPGGGRERRDGSVERDFNDRMDTRGVRSSKRDDEMRQSIPCRVADVINLDTIRLLSHSIKPMERELEKERMKEKVFSQTPARIVHVKGRGDRQRRNADQELRASGIFTVPSPVGTGFSFGDGYIPSPTPPPASHATLAEPKIGPRRSSSVRGNKIEKTKKARKFVGRRKGSGGEKRRHEDAERVKEKENDDWSDEDCIGHVEKIVGKRQMADGVSWEYYCKWVKADGSDSFYVWLKGDDLLPSELEIFEAEKEAKKEEERQDSD
ncbi:hypothetical protein BLNAU_19643 [Blattamonas nauphoetae]|uniref:Chromo domain-containing protein n=1 Tax=Blattamonas nauphoetae TaxID=2049346 RepID=A0ABQ9X0W9_9EUKA|nr:hypothetical protein BLNAU_19643 [Blattamonas nauphoetae]